MLKGETTLLIPEICLKNTIGFSSLKWAQLVHLYLSYLIIMGQNLEKKKEIVFLL